MRILMIITSSILCVGFLVLNLNLGAFEVSEKIPTESITFEKAQHCYNLYINGVEANHLVI